jgi:hypothetical protein
MYQEVLYGLLPPGHRVQVHRRIAAREEAGYSERSNEIATELAHHYSLGTTKTRQSTISGLLEPARSRAAQRWRRRLL